MSTTAAPTQKDLREQLTAAEQEVRDATAALGAAQLDHQDPKPASDRVAEAHATVARLEAAKRELAEREQRERDAEHERAQAIKRWREVSWYAEFVKRIVPVIELREQLNAAERHAMALGGAARARGVNAMDYNRPRAIVALRLPEIAVADADEDRFKWPDRRRAAAPLLTAEQLEAAAKELGPLVEAAAKRARALGADTSPASLPWSE